MDQGLFAFSNFAINLYLARWLSKDGYGSFALAYTVFLFVGVIHTSLFTDPMLVFGSGRFREGQRSYLRDLLGIHWRVGWVGTGLLIAAVAAAYWNNPARPTMIALVPLCGVLLYQWLMRRACYLRQRSDLAAAAGAIYLVIVLGGLWLMYAAGRLGPVGALGLMASASLASAWFIRWRLFAPGGLTDGESLPRRELAREHWNYGRWGIAAGVIGWLAGNLAMVSLPWWHGNAATGELRAAMNLVLPIQQLLAAAGPLLVPFLVGRRDSPGFRRTAVAVGFAFMVAPLLWALFLAVGGPWLGELLYGGRYELGRFTLLLFGLQAAVSSFGLIMATALRAMELPKLAFHGYAVAACVAVAVGLPLIALHGVAGAAVGLVLSAAACSLVLARTIFRTTRLPVTSSAGAVAV